MPIIGIALEKEVTDLQECLQSEVMGNLKAALLGEYADLNPIKIECDLDGGDVYMANVELYSHETPDDETRICSLRKSRAFRLKGSGAVSAAQR